MVRTECEDVSNGGGTYVRTECGRGRAMAVAKHSRAKEVHYMFPAWSYLMYGHNGKVRVDKFRLGGDCWK
jgi:hypothetical protein